VLAPPTNLDFDCNILLKNSSVFILLPDLARELPFVYKKKGLSG